MSEVRLIDANALMERFAEMQKVKPDEDGREYACNFQNMGGEPSTEWFAVEDAVENAPNVDAVPVCRCKECKYIRESVDGLFKSGYFCERCHITSDMDNVDDWFCADGERR